MLIGVNMAWQKRPRPRHSLAFMLLLVVTVTVVIILSVEVNGRRRFPRKLNVRRDADARYHSVTQMNAYERFRFGYAHPREMPHGRARGDSQPYGDHDDYDHDQPHRPAYTCNSQSGPPEAYPTELGEPDDQDGEECFKFVELPTDFTIVPFASSSNTSCRYQYYKVTPEQSTNGESVCDYICSEDNTDNCRGQYRDRYMSMPICQCTEESHRTHCSNPGSQATSMFGIVNGHIPRFLQAVTTDIDQRSRPRSRSSSGSGMASGSGSSSGNYCGSYGEYMGHKCNAICKQVTDEDGEVYGGGYHLRLPVSDNSCKDLPYYILEACVCSCQYIIDERIQCRG